SGGRLVVVPAAATHAPEELYRLLARERVTVLNLTPSVLGALAHYRQEAVREMGSLALKALHCGGEALPREVAREALGWGVPLFNFYGPTESTVWATLQRVTAADLERPVAPIGKPFAGRRVYVLDRNLEP